MEIVKAEIVSLEKSCKHCGGIMRYYLGSWSCMMCGRDSEHECPRCKTVQVASRPGELLKTA
ncbi:MAG: hypothetical protein HZB29_12725 [Nitrospinae bacterium]|nr:hypothetical protein [Nitrospinota bacterium]